MFFKKVEIIGVRKGILNVLEALGDGEKKTFTEISESAALSPATISLRLIELQQLNLVKKEVENRPGRVLIQYQITESGKKF